MEISFHSHLDSNAVIATKFCTWHDSCAVVACTKICCDLMASNGFTARRIFHRIWIAGKTPLVKRAPEMPYHGDEINYPFLKFTGCTAEVWKWKSNFIPHFIGMWLFCMPGFKFIHVSKRVPKVLNIDKSPYYKRQSVNPDRVLRITGGSSAVVASQSISE